MAATGVDPITALSASATTINIVGPGLGEIGATDDFTAIPEAGRLVASFLMLAGRLEIFTVVALLASVFQLHKAGVGYARRILAQLTNRPTVDELSARIKARGSVELGDSTVEAVRRIRDHGE